MIIKKITATNFKGFEQFILEPKGKMIAITGKNGKGKSTTTEMLRYAITGIAPENVITTGKDEMMVDVSLDSGIEFTRSVHVTKPSKVTLCGKASTAKNLADQLQSETGIEQAVMKLASSAEVLENLKPEELGQLFLKYIPEELDFDSVISYIPNITPEMAAELSQLLPEMPELFGMSLINEAYDSFCEIRKEAKKERDNCKVKANSFIGEPPLKTLAEAEKELEDLTRQEGAAAGAIALEKAYKQAVELHEKQETSIKDLKTKIDANSATRPNPQVLDDILAKKKICTTEIVESEKLQQTLENTIELLRKTVEDLGKPICPISNKLVCNTDRSHVEEELKDTIKENTEGLEYQKNEVAKHRQAMNDLTMKEDEYRKNASEYEKKILLMSQLTELQKNLVTVPAKPASVTTVDYAVAKEEIKKEITKIRQYEDAEKEKAKLLILEERVKMYEAIVSALAPKGVVVEGVTKHYISIFEQVCNDRASILKPDFQIKFVYEDGVKIMCQPKAGSDFLPYSNVSAGEKAVVMFLILDMINAMCGLNILILDELEKLDKDVFECLMKLLSDPVIQNDYDHIIVCAVDHEDTINTLSNIQNIEWIKL